MVNQSGNIPDAEYLRIFAISPDPVLSAPEISEHLPVSNQAVNKRLQRMERDGILESKKVGSAAKVYWLTAEGRKELAELEFRNG